MCHKRLWGGGTAHYRWWGDERWVSCSWNWLSCFWTPQAVGVGWGGGTVDTAICWGMWRWGAVDCVRNVDRIASDLLVRTSSPMVCGMKVSKGLTQAYQMQDLAFDAAMRLRAELAGQPMTKDTVQSIAALTRAWCDAQERIRIHRGKPLPGSKRPAATAPRTSGTGAGGLT